MMLPLTTHSIVKYVLKQAEMMLPPHYTFHSKLCTETGQNDATPSLHHSKVFTETSQNDAAPSLHHSKVCTETSKNDATPSLHIP